MRRLLAGLVLVGTMACGSDMTGPPKADVAGPCTLHFMVREIQVNVGYKVCPSDSAFDATVGAGNYWLTPGLPTG